MGTLLAIWMVGALLYYAMYKERFRRLFIRQEILWGYSWSNEISIWITSLFFGALGCPFLARWLYRDGIQEVKASSYPDDGFSQQRSERQLEVLMTTDRVTFRQSLREMLKTPPLYCLFAAMIASCLAGLFSWGIGILSCIGVLFTATMGYYRESNRKRDDSPTIYE